MANTGAHISNVSLLEDLNNEIEQSGKKMADIERGVSNYLDSVTADLDRQLDFLREKLEEAQQRLSQAEQAASSCHSSQIFVPELGGYVPTCISEEMAVVAAQEEVAEWQHKYQEGQRIVNECQQEIADYNGVGGGRELIMNMANNQTPKAIERLRDCINKLEDIYASNVVDDRNDYGVGVDVKIDKPSQAAGSDKRLDAFRNSVHKKD